MGEGEGRRRLTPCVKETMSPASLTRMEVEEEEQGLVIGLVVVRDPRSWAFEERPMGIGGCPRRESSSSSGEAESMAASRTVEPQ